MYKIIYSTIPFTNSPYTFRSFIYFSTVLYKLLAPLEVRVGRSARNPMVVMTPLFQEVFAKDETSDMLGN